MTTQEAIEKLNRVLSHERCGVNVFFVLHKQENYILKKADVQYVALEKIEKTIRVNVEKLKLELESEALTIMNLSTADERKDVIYAYDLDDTPTPIQLINEMDENIFNNEYFSVENNNVYNFNDDNLNEVDAWIASYGVGNDHIVIYRKTYPVNLLKQNNVFIFKDHSQFKAIGEEIFRIDGKIDFLKIQDEILIKDISILEKFNDFKDIVLRSATNSIQIIAELDIIEDISQLKNRMSSDLSFARKLIKVVANSLILSTIPKENIISFATTHPYLSKKLKISANNKFDLSKKIAQNHFIQLLDDAFLHSKLSNNEYVSPAKDKL